MKIRVECYAGYKAEERPLRFFAGDRRYEVEKVVDQWYSPGARFVRVEADDGNLYILRREEKTGAGEWTLEAYRRKSSSG